MKKLSKEFRTKEPSPVENENFDPIQTTYGISLTYEKAFLHQYESFMGFSTMKHNQHWIE